MSILGYSSSYFLPEYWAASPLYGEKIIPLIDYILSTDYTETDKLATAFYNLENKYKNTANLPIEQIEAIIEESGYGYVRDLLGNDEESIRLLTYLLVLIHQLKGSKAGIEVVLNLLRSNQNPMILAVVGNPTISVTNYLSDLTPTDYVYFKGFTTDDDSFQLKFQIKTGSEFSQEQTIASVNGNLLYLGINTEGKLILSLGNISSREVSSTILQRNTDYYIKVNFDGNEYNVQLSTDDKKYKNVINIASSEPLKAHENILFLGVDGSSETITKPFLGEINLSTLSTTVENLSIEQWFETEPMGEEDTFAIKADLDINILSSDFFKNFANFVKRYVYPSLAAFEAKLNLENNVTFLPYTRQKILYVALGELLEYSQFMVIMQNNPGQWEDFYSLNSDEETWDAFQSLAYILVPVGPDGTLILRGSNDGLWSLPNNAYAGNTYLETLKITNVRSLEVNSALNSAFNRCDNLTSVEFTDLREINANNALSSTFSDCPSLEEVKFPQLRKVSGNYAMDQAFSYCEALSTLSIPRLEVIEGDYALYRTFINCFRNLGDPIDLTFYQLKSISGDYAMGSTFNGCSNIVSASFPKLESVKGEGVFADTFYGCNNLTTLSFPQLKYISGDYAFGNLFSSNLVTSIGFPELVSINV